MSSSDIDTSVAILYIIQVMSELKGKDLNEVIANGMGKLASMPSGTYSPQPFTKMLILCTGGAVAVSSAPAGGDAPAEEKKEEKKKEESEDESDDDMGFGLFD